MNSYIYDAVKTLPVIDTHEHLPWDETRRSPPDFLQDYLAHYMRSDVISAGLRAIDTVTNPEIDIHRRWAIAEPYWETCRYTGYGRALDIAVAGIYGIDGIRTGTVEALDKAYKRQNIPGHCWRVLKDMCGIEVSILDNWTERLEGSNPLFKRAWQPQDFINPMQPNGWKLLDGIYERYGITVTSLDDWLEALEREMDYYLKAYDTRILKNIAAYFRPLRFENTPYETARQLFAGHIDRWKGRAAQKECLDFPTPLQDYIMRHMLGLAGRRGLTVQFHTGLQEGNGNNLTNSDPSLLIDLFSAFPDVNFDLFHIGYPYYGKACAICKNYPNVTLDMCWVHIISPNAAVAALSEFLDALPYNKISAFGGDYAFVDGVYGHLQLARENVSRTLSEKVRLGIFTEEKAVDIAKALFYDNPKRIFQL